MMQYDSFLSPVFFLNKKQNKKKLIKQSEFELCTPVLDPFVLWVQPRRRASAHTRTHTKKKIFIESEHLYLF